MLNTPLIADMIFKGEVAEIKEIMKTSRDLGMQTFDQALFDLYETKSITYEDALRNADSVNDLRLQIKLNSHARARPTCPRAPSTWRSSTEPTAAANGPGPRETGFAGSLQDPACDERIGRACDHHGSIANDRRTYDNAAPRRSPSSAWA